MQPVDVRFGKVTDRYNFQYIVPYNYQIIKNENYSYYAVADTNCHLSYYHTLEPVDGITNRLQYMRTLRAELPTDCSRQNYWLSPTGWAIWVWPAGHYQWAHIIDWMYGLELRHTSHALDDEIEKVHGWIHVSSEIGCFIPKTITQIQYDWAFDHRNSHPMLWTAFCNYPEKANIK